MLPNGQIFPVCNTWKCFSDGPGEGGRLIADKRDQNGNQSGLTRYVFLDIPDIPNNPETPIIIKISLSL